MNIDIDPQTHISFIHLPEEGAYLVCARSMIELEKGELFLKSKMTQPMDIGVIVASHFEIPTGLAMRLSDEGIALEQVQTADKMSLLLEATRTQRNIKEALQRIQEFMDGEST